MRGMSLMELLLLLLEATPLFVRRTALLLRLTTLLLHTKVAPAARSSLARKSSSALLRTLAWFSSAVFASLRVPLLTAGAASRS